MKEPVHVATFIVHWVVSLIVNCNITIESTLEEERREVFPQGVLARRREGLDWMEQPNVKFYLQINCYLCAYYAVAVMRIKRGLDDSAVRATSRF